VTLLALVSAQTQTVVCDGSDTDIASTIVADLVDIVREADLHVDTSVDVEITNSDTYKASVTAKFSSNIDLTADQTTQIEAAVKARVDNLQARFEAQTALAKAATLICIRAKRDYFVGLLDTINTQVSATLVASYALFSAYKSAVKDAFDAWQQALGDNSAVAIATATISYQAQIAIQWGGDVAFYLVFVQQEQRTNWKAVGIAFDAYANALAANPQVAADVTATRANLDAALKAAITASIDLRRAQALKDKVNAEIETIKTRLAEAKTRLDNAVAQAWAEVRAQIVSVFANVAAQIEAHRQRLQDYLASIRCDTATATITVNQDGTNGAVTVQIRGITCYADKPIGDLQTAWCAAVRAYFVMEGAQATVNTYACNAVAKKRALGQSGQTVNGDIVANDPNANPPPVSTNASPSVVACIVLLLVACLFHF
jgi:gas vesicle protein